MSAKLNLLPPTPICVAVERVKLPLRGGGVPRVTSSGSIGIPTSLHPLTYLAGTASAKDDFEGQNSPTVYDAQNVDSELLLNLLCLGLCCALLDYVSAHEKKNLYANPFVSSTPPVPAASVSAPVRASIPISVRDSLSLLSGLPCPFLSGILCSSPIKVHSIPAIQTR